MKILVVGGRGFVGKILTATVRPNCHDFAPFSLPECCKLKENS